MRYNFSMDDGGDAAGHWAEEPHLENVDAARDYLVLQYEPRVAGRIADDLAKVETLRVYTADDLLRAAGLEPLRRKDRRVRAQLEVIGSDEQLAPVLLARDVSRHALVIADGLDRLCASRIADPGAIVACRIVTVS